MAPALWPPPAPTGSAVADTAAQIVAVRHFGRIVRLPAARAGRPLVRRRSGHGCGSPGWCGIDPGAGRGVCEGTGQRAGPAPTRPGSAVLGSADRDEVGRRTPAKRRRFEVYAGAIDEILLREHRAQRGAAAGITVGDPVLHRGCPSGVGPCGTDTSAPWRCPSGARARSSAGLSSSHCVIPTIWPWTRQRPGGWRAGSSDRRGATGRAGPARPARHRLFAPGAAGAAGG